MNIDLHYHFLKEGVGLTQKALSTIIEIKNKKKAMNRDNFWNDQRVKEFVLDYNKVDKLITGVDPIMQTLQEWKASHTSAIEEREGRDWEIVFFEVIKSSGIAPEGYVLESDGLYHAAMGSPKKESELLGHPWLAIKKVRRKSDGVVLSVNSETDNGKITSFKLGGGDAPNMYAYVCHNGITAIKPLAEINPIPQRTKLFTTEDGVDIYDGIKFSAVQKESFQILHGCIHPLTYPNNWWTFSTKEKAEEFAMINKPLNLSMKELASCVTNYICKGRPFEGIPDRSRTEIDFNKLDELIKSKIAIK